MKYFLLLFAFFPVLAFAQKEKSNNPADKLGEHPLYVIDSVITKTEEFIKINPKTKPAFAF